MKTRFFILLLIGLATPSPGVWAGNLPKAHLVPGGIGVFDVGSANQPAPEVRFGRQRAMVVNDGASWKAIIGLPLDLLPGQYIFLTKNDETSEFISHTFEVFNKQYPAERVAPPTSMMETPAASSPIQLRQERKEIFGIFRRWTSDATNPLPLQAPANGRLIDQFGKRRFSKGEPLEPYTGLDIATAPGSPLYAPADGVVAAIDHFPSYGNSMLIEHGEGLVSMLSGLRDVMVKKGDAVTRGQIIGKSGENGTHGVEWKVSLNDARINPLILLEQPTAEQTSKKTNHKSDRKKKKAR